MGNSEKFMRLSNLRDDQPNPSLVEDHSRAE